MQRSSGQQVGPTTLSTTGSSTCVTEFLERTKDEVETISNRKRKNHIKYGSLSIYPMNSARAASFKNMVFVYLFVERQEVWPSLSLHTRTAQLDNKYSPEADFPRIAHFTEWQHLF
jgi:hypothetical protein